MTTPTKEHRAEALTLCGNPNPDDRAVTAVIDHWVTTGMWVRRTPGNRLLRAQNEFDRVAQALADRDARIGELVTEALESAAALTVAKSQLADAEERGRQTERQRHLELTRRFVRALTVLSQDKPEHWSALREECEDVLTQARAALEGK